MTVKETIELEEANKDKIYLHKEGIFWRAYNRSAMHLVNNLKSLKIIHRYIKKVKQEIFYCGFPESSLDKIKRKAAKKGFQITETGDKKIIITHIPAKNNYKNRIENQQELNEAAVQYVKRNDTGNIIRQIQQYPLENATPIETMLFIQKLKQSVKDGFV